MLPCVTHLPSESGETIVLLSSSRTKRTSESNATIIYRRPTTATYRHSSQAEMANTDGATSFTTSSGSSPLYPQTLCITDANIPIIAAFFMEQNITLPPDYTGAALITFMRNFIAYKVEADVLRTSARILHTGNAIITIKFSTPAACRHAFQILSQSKAFEGCKIQCLDDCLMVYPYVTNFVRHANVRPREYLTVVSWTVLERWGPIIISEPDSPWSYILFSKPKPNNNAFHFSPLALPDSCCEHAQSTP
ncbi:hypothetical protein HOY82DRAFT_538220 [Tuber indicum]|nr:hypothetical protein HOY82DRAFT_538220 [Tuber indicum]